MPKSLAEQLAEVRRAIPAKDRSSPTASQATAPIHDDFSAYRPITPQEHALLTALLHLTQPDAIAFLPQLEGLRARSSCTCGCPTIALGVSPEHPPIRYPNKFIVDVTGDADGLFVGVMLSQAGGRLTELDVYAFGDFTGPFGFPSPQSLKRME